MNKTAKRQLSSHICSRFYRAPEIILLEKDYGQALDMWSVGCILAELLQIVLPAEGSPVLRNSLDGIFSAMQNEQRVLFEGNTCYPLTPLKNVVLGHVDYNDQLRHILDVIGKPGE